MNTKLKIGDFIVVIVIIISSIGIFFISKNRISDKDGDKYASIQVNGTEIERVKIDEEVNGRILPIDTEFGYNVLEFTSKGVRSIEASCPDQIDVKQGYIYETGETIVCLPNRLVVEIISDINVDDVDVVN